MIRKGEIVKIVKASDYKLENKAFLIVSEGEEEVMSEDGTLSIEKVLYGYPLVLLSNGNFTVISHVRTSLLYKSFTFENIAKCSYIFIPQIILIDETENQSEEAQ